MQKAGLKNTKYSRYETILKKGIAFNCKILTLHQKIKFQKACEKPFYKSFRVVPRKKAVEKNRKYLRNKSILKINRHAKAIAFAKSSL